MKVYYFVAQASRAEAAEQDLGKGEDIEANWIPISEFLQAVLNGEVHEDRTVAQLVRLFSDRISTK